MTLNTSNNQKMKTKNTSTEKSERTRERASESERRKKNPRQQELAIPSEVAIPSRERERESERASPTRKTPKDPWQLRFGSITCLLPTYFPLRSSDEKETQALTHPFHTSYANLQKLASFFHLLSFSSRHPSYTSAFLHPPRPN